MSDFNYKVRIPTDEEYDHLVSVTVGDNVVMHWDHIFSWVDDPELIEKNSNRRAFRGYRSARRYTCNLADSRHVHVGFRPAFEPLDNDTPLANIADGDIITIGTLYMDNTPVKVPRNPMYYGDVEDYIPGASLEFKPALENPAYQIQAIKCGDILICDRCLLKNISYDDITSEIPNADSSHSSNNRNATFKSWSKIEPLESRDEVLEEFWNRFTDIPIDPETGRIEEKFLGWESGVNREEILHWFDKRHSKGVAYLLYGGGPDYTVKASELMLMKQLCFECESKDCQFNHGGECRFALVHERKPRINDADGCIDYDYKESDN